MFCLFWLNTYHQFRYLHCVFHVCRGKQAKIRQQKKRQHAKTLQYNATLMEEELRHDNAIIADAPPATPPPATPPLPESPSLPPLSAANRAVRCRLPIGIQQSAESLPQPAVERSPSPAAPSQGWQDWPLLDNHYPTPPPAPRKDQTPLSSSEWDSGSDCCEGGPIPQGPLKILRSESLLVHKSCGGPLPIGYVDTGLYEGGRRDWFEAFTPRDLTWAIRMDYVLRRHNIYRR
jgi:hypothetical protein